ncbi:MAG TPA: hypothetical protein VFJ06_12205 [Halococcus sp.]|nr:hypothetical protein [Halococcus sp.]
MSYYENYCVECGWSASKKDHSTSELATLAVEHAVSTGHDIDSGQTFGDRDADFDAEIGSDDSASATGFGGYHEHS